MRLRISGASFVNIRDCSWPCRGLKFVNTLLTKILAAYDQQGKEKRVQASLGASGIPVSLAVLLRRERTHSQLEWLVCSCARALGKWTVGICSR